MSPKPTIFILSHCRPQYLSEAVQSVLNLNIPRERIIVLDNGSPEDLMEEFRNKFNQFIIWVGSDKNNGGACNFKRAIEMSRTEYLMVLHDDDRLIKDSISVQIEILEKNPHLVALSSNGYIIDDRGSRTGLLVLPNMPTKGIKNFDNSVQVGMHVYGDSCIPFSPTIYKTEFLKLTLPYYDSLIINSGPVGDVILQMKLADFGPIGLNFVPLYECRRHEFQHSASIDDHFNRLLREYCLRNCNGNEYELAMLRKKIPEAYTFSILYRLFKSITSFNFAEALQIIRGLQTSYLAPAGITLFLKIGIYKLLNRNH